MNGTKVKGFHLYVQIFFVGRKPGLPFHFLNPFFWLKFLALRSPKTSSLLVVLPFFPADKN
jgi:hypothetical protein